MTRTFLNTLPAEVFEQIAEHSEARELKSLRLLSREACSKVFRVYTRKLFEHQAFFLNSQESLELALKITQHDIYGPAMKNISFLVDGVRSQKALRDEIRTTHKLRHAALIGSSALEQEHAALMEDYQWQFDAADKQDQFQLFGPRVILLYRIFANMVKIGMLQELELTDRDNTKCYPAIMPGMEGFSRNDKMQISHAHDHRPFHLVSEPLQHACATTSTKFVLSSFTSRAGGRCLVARHLNQYGRFNGIQSLDLTVCAAGVAGQLSSFATSLEIASRDTLKSLTVKTSVCSSQNTEELMASILSPTYQNLEILRLHVGRIETTHLPNFVKRQLRLRKLDLHDMVIMAEEDSLGVLEEEGIESMLRVAGTREGITYVVKQP